MSNLILGHNEDAVKAAISAPKPNTLKLTDYPSEVCPKCGGKLFVPAYVIKDVPGLAFGNITVSKVPMPVEQLPIFVCVKCGEIAPAMEYQKEMKDAMDKLLGSDVKDSSTI